MKIQFKSDKVKIKTGKADNSADVIFEVGEYQLKEIAELVSVIDKEIKVTIEY